MGMGRWWATGVVLLGMPLWARAVIVRGKVTSPLGEPLPGARIQLIQGQRSVADAIAGTDGSYEIRTSLDGRFLLLVAPPAMLAGYAPQIGSPFYGSRASLVTIDIALNRAGITAQVSRQETLVPKPLKQLASPVEQVRADELLTNAFPVEELEARPSVVLARLGGMGEPVGVFLRGAPPQTISTTVDGVTANPVGGTFNLEEIATTAIAAVDARPGLELEPGANPLHLTGAAGGELALHRAEAMTPGRSLTYTGDAGTLGALRNEVVASDPIGRLDLLGEFSRFDLADVAPVEPFHLIAWAGTVGYHVSAGTSLIASARYDTSATALPSPYDFFLVNPEGKSANQNLFGTATFDTRTAGGWHNMLRYGLARERGQTYDFFTPADGLPVTIAGANGYRVSGTAAFDPLPSREDRVTGRDEATYQTDYAWKPWLRLLGEARFQDEHAADILPTVKETLDRTHLSAAGGFEGEARHRFFYEASGFLDHTQLLGWTGSPRVGLTYAPVRPGRKFMRGTSLHVSAATGTREPSLLEHAAVARPATPRSRTLDALVEQNIVGEKLTLRAGYFHSQFSHEFEPIVLGAVASQPLLSQTLALRTEGAEAAMRYLPFRRLALEGGYNYLASVTEQSAEAASFNPAFPEVPIGGLTALRGQRPFDRPPQSGFLRAEYSGSRVNASLQGAFVSHSNGSTQLMETPGLLLPNRDLSPGYASLDGHLSVVLTSHITMQTQMTNLADNPHLGPIGYVSTPFLIRVGMRIRFGGE